MNEHDFDNPADFLRHKEIRRKEQDAAQEKEDEEKKKKARDAVVDPFITRDRKNEEETDKLRRENFRIAEEKRLERKKIEEEEEEEEAERVRVDWAKKTCVEKAAILAIRGGKKLFFRIGPIVGKLFLRIVQGVLLLGFRAVTGIGLCLNSIVVWIGRKYEKWVNTKT